VVGEGRDLREILVVSIQCAQRERGREILTADVSTEDGSVLAESPAFEIPRYWAGGGSPAGEAIEAIEAWLERQTPLIQDELSRAPHAA